MDGASAAVVECRRALERGSKSFAFAGRLLSPRRRDDAAVVYAWCRRVDDAIDECNAELAPQSLARLVAELDRLYRGQDQADLTLRAFADVVRRRRIPKQYPDELLAGMAMDVEGARYQTFEDLHRYCHRVAGVVGLMMCHVLGLSRQSALAEAAQLGWAMQLTNICRDVLEDWNNGRLYLPADMLEREGLVDLRPRGPFPDEAVEPVSRVLRELLAQADSYYLRAEGGFSALDSRSALAIATARFVYAEIGEQIAAQNHDVRRGRAVVPFRRKVELTARAALAVAQTLPKRASPSRLLQDRQGRRAAPSPLRSLPEKLVDSIQDRFGSQRLAPPRIRTCALPAPA